LEETWVRPPKRQKMQPHQCGLRQRHNGADLTPAEWAEHWQRCCREAAEADIALMVACAEERQMGALVEVGSALGAGKRVFLYRHTIGRGSIIPASGCSIRWRQRSMR
jgi:hypothetical protein